MKELLEWMEYIEDKRQQRKVRHTLKDILGGVLVGLGAGAAGYYLVITLQERIGRRKKNGADEL